MKKNARVLSVAILLLSFVAPSSGPLVAEEGMWTFDNPPVLQLKEKYGFEPTAQWLEHLRLASVRLNDGGSGSFVSPDGLLLTNHHVAAGQIQKLSTRDRNLSELGFYARTTAEELKCPDLEINVLVGVENVTHAIQSATKGQSAKLSWRS